MGALPPVFIEFLGSATGFMATSRHVKTELATVEAQGAGNMRRLGGVAKAALLGVGVAAGVAAVKTVHMAADFQTQMTRVRTGAGEAAKNMDMVGSGVLRMAGRVGESTKDLTAGLYMVESAGYHGADALTVLETSAKGAKVGAADLATVTDAVTTAMNAYKMGAGQTNEVMNALVGTEAEGKTNLEALAGSMSGILPVSSAAKVKLNEVLGAMATMTSQGTDARVAATYLRQTIGQLSNPSAKAAATMAGLGLNANKVAKELGTKGLSATLETLTDAIKNKMGPGGDVFIKTLQKAAKSGKDFDAALNRASGSKKTYIGALATMVGGTKSMMGALQLTGPHMDTFKKNVQGISDHVKEGGKNVEGWKDVQATLNQRMAEFKGAAEGIGISIGQKLLPAVTKLFGGLSKGLTFLQSHSIYLKTFGVVMAGVTIGLAAASIASWSFTDSLLANPITWIVAGIVALVAGLALLIVKWRSVWSWIKTNIPAVANAFKATWRVAVRVFWQLWDQAVKASQVAVKWFDRNVLKWVRARMADLTTWWKAHSKQISQAWSLVWSIVQTEAKISFSWLKVTLTLLAGAWKLTWGLIKDTTKVVWAALSGTITTVMHEVMNIIAIVLDVITGHWGKAWKDLKKLVSQSFHDTISLIKGVTSSFGTLLTNAGKNLIQGLIDGAKSMAGAAVETVKGIGSSAVSSIKSVLGIHSPSRVFRDEVGKWIPIGLAEGVIAHASHAHAAMVTTADGMVRSFSNRLGIASPSKVFRSLGIWIHQGLVQGLTGSLSQVKSAIKKTETMLMQATARLHDMSHTAAAKGSKGAGLRHWIAQHEDAVHRMEKYVAKEGKALTKLAQQRADVAGKLKSAQDKLKGLQSAWTAMRDDIANGMIQNASIVMQSQDDGSVVTTGGVIANMQNQLAAAKQFASQLDALKRKGLSGDLLQQIASAGVEQGGATAAALLGANSGQIKQLNGMQTQLKKAAKSAGTLVADDMYKNGINAAKGLVKGLQSQEKAIDKQMLRIAKAMETAIKKALGIKSPSRVFHEIGKWVTAGFINGMDTRHDDIRKVAARWRDHAILGATDGGPAPTLSGTAGMAHAVNQHVHIEVHGSVLTESKLRDIMQREFLRQGARNPRTYPSYKR